MLVNRLDLLHRGTYISCGVYDMAGVGLKGNTPKRTVSPAFTAMSKGSVSCETDFDPGGDAESDAFGLVLHHLGLSDMGRGKVDAEVAQRTVLGGYNAHGKHASVEDEVGSLAVDSEVLKLLNGDAYNAVGMLVVVTDIKFAYKRLVVEEVILAFLKTEYRALAVTFMLYMPYGTAWICFVFRSVFRDVKNVLKSITFIIGGYLL